MKAGHRIEYKVIWCCSRCVVADPEQFEQRPEDHDARLVRHVKDSRIQGSSARRMVPEFQAPQPLPSSHEPGRTRLLGVQRQSICPWSRSQQARPGDQAPARRRLARVVPWAEPGGAAESETGTGRCTEPAEVSLPAQPRRKMCRAAAATRRPLVVASRCSRSVGDNQQWNCRHPARQASRQRV